VFSNFEILRWGHEFDLSGSRDVIDHATNLIHLIPRRPFPIGGPLAKPIPITLSEIFNSECDAMVDMTLNR